MSQAQENLDCLHVIGRIHTPFEDHQGIPFQGTANRARGTIALRSSYAEGLGDLEGFDRIWLIYIGEPVSPVRMRIIPKLDETSHGVFATRSRLHPNPIGMTCVKLVKIDGTTLHVEGVDMLDGTALLDIKPYVPRYDSHPDAWAGWLENRIPHEDAWRDGMAAGK